MIGMDVSKTSPQKDVLSELVSMLSSQDPNSPDSGHRTTVTEVIHVPSSEHVAQIVGKSGSKIKSLRAKTNTCIKTPLRGDEPVFTVTGNPENVRMASMAIHSASQHFSNLMSSRTPTCNPGEVTLHVSVPQQYVGVVVGRNGSVIMRIKEQTNTRINTPKDDSSNPSFEIIGSQANALAAEEAIRDRVSQAYQLRLSSIFDPNLDPSKLQQNSRQTNTMPITRTNFNPFPTQGTGPTLDVPIRPQSSIRIITHKSDANKSLLVNSGDRQIHSRSGYSSGSNVDTKIGNILYENFFKNY